MTKTTWWTVRVSEALDVRAYAEAERRGMNLSEFVRYAVTLFFDHLDDSKPQSVDSDEVPA